MKHVCRRRRPLRAATAFLATVAVVAGLAAPTARADVYSPQPSNPSATNDAAGWFRLSGEGAVYRFAGAGHSQPGSFAVARGSAGSEVTVGTCLDTGSYVIAGATYRVRFHLQNWRGFGTNLRYEVRRGPGTGYATLLPSTPMASGDAFAEIVSPPFVADGGALPCILFTGGAWPESAPWDSFAVDDVLLDVESYPVPAAEVAPRLVASGPVQDGQTLTHEPATWSIRAPYPVTRTASFQRCNAVGGACETIGTSPVGTAHVLTQADVGHTIRVLDTAVNAEGESQSAVSAASAVVVPLPRPEPTSTPVVQSGGGGTLSVDVRWPEGTTLTYGWFRCAATGTGCAPIPGATSAVYTLTRADAGTFVLVRVTAGTSGGTTTVEAGYAVPGPISAAGARRRAALSVSVDRTRVETGAPVTVTGRLPGVPRGTRLVLTLVHPQWKRHARRYTVRTGAKGRFSVRVRPVVSAAVKVAFAGTSTVRAAIRSSRRILVTPRIALAVSATADGPGQVRDLRIRGRFAPGFGRGARLQLEGRPEGGSTWYSFCTRLTVGRGGVIDGACNVARLHTTNSYRLVYVAQAGSSWTTARSKAVRARVTG